MALCLSMAPPSHGNSKTSYVIILPFKSFLIVLPETFTIGSFAPYYDRLSGLIDRTSAAFPVVNGKVRMQIEVVLDAMPGLAAALPAPASAPQAGGR